MSVTDQELALYSSGNGDAETRRRIAKQILDDIAADPATAERWESLGGRETPSIPTEVDDDADDESFAVTHQPARKSAASQLVTIAVVAAIVLVALFLLISRESAVAAQGRTVEGLNTASMRILEAKARLKVLIEQADHDAATIAELENIISLASGSLDENERVIAEEPTFPGDKSKFIMDVTIPDGTVVAPKSRFIKTWRIQNVGIVLWKNRFLLRADKPISGPTLDSAKLSAMGTTRPNETVDVSVELTAPAEPGVYYAEWKMVDSRGSQLLPHKSPVYVLVRVEAK